MPHCFKKIEENKDLSYIHFAARFKFLRFKIWFAHLKVKNKTGQVFISNQRVPKRFGTPYGFRNPCMLPSTDTYSWHFNVRCMQMDSLIFHSSNYIASSRQARSAKVSWNVEFLKILFPYPSAFSNKNEKRIWWQVRRRGRASREGKNVLIQFFLFLNQNPWLWLTDRYVHSKA